MSAMPHTAELMSVALDENLRCAMAVALRALEDRIAAAHTLYKQSSSQGRPSSAQSWAAKIGELEQQVDVLRGAMRRIDDIAFHSTQE